MHNFNNIDWNTVELALSSFQIEDQQRLILFIHKKLPLRASKAHLHHGFKLCPSCQRIQEDAKHLLECSNPERTKLFSDLKNKLTLYTQKTKLHPCIFTAIWLGLVMTRTDTPYPEIFDEVLQPLQPSIQSQVRIGWQQLYYSWMVHQWADAIDAIHPCMNATGEHIILHLIKILWTYFLDLWKLRNTHLHHNAATLDLLDYKQVAETLYAQ